MNEFNINRKKKCDIARPKEPPEIEPGMKIAVFLEDEGNNDWLLEKKRGAGSTS